MKKISIQSVAVSNLVTGEPVFCEFELCSQTYKTKVFKNDITLDQAFNLGVLNVTDKLTLSFKGKRSGEILATNFISLDQFAAQGSYEHTIIVGEICKVSLQILVSSSGGGIRRSTSLQNIKEKFTRFLQKEKKEEEPEGGGGPAISQITHSHSHMGDLSVEASAPLKEKLKDELPSSVDSTPRRRRKKRTKDETEDSTDIKPRHKREKDLLCKEQKSPMRERRKKKNRIDGSDSEKSERREKSRSNSSSPKNSRRREKSNNSSKKEGESKMKKSKLSDTNETKSEKKTEETAEKKSEPESKVDESKPLESGAEPKRRTVVLQPIGKGKKLFGSPLDEVMAQQKETHPDLDVPIFFQTADKIIREKGFDVQGIFRIRGKLKEVKELKAKIDNGENLDEECCNVHLVATLVKAFLRELPVPILTFENYDAFIAAADYKGEEQIDKLADIMSSLPKENYDLTKFIFSLLHDLSVKAEITQMTSDNLAKVISPNLIWKKELDIMDLSAVQDATKGNAIASVLIDNNSKIFRS